MFEIICVRWNRWCMKDFIELLTQFMQKFPYIFLDQLVSRMLCQACASITKLFNKRCVTFEMNEKYL